MPKPKSQLRFEAEQRQLAYNDRVDQLFFSVYNGVLDPYNLTQFSPSQYRRLRELYPSQCSELCTTHPFLTGFFGGSDV